MALNDCKNKDKRIKKLRERIAHLEEEINSTRDKIWVMEEEIRSLCGQC